jgi:hypothetical protein
MMLMHDSPREAGEREETGRMIPLNRRQLIKGAAGAIAAGRINTQADGSGITKGATHSPSG